MKNNEKKIIKQRNHTFFILIITLLLIPKLTIKKIVKITCNIIVDNIFNITFTIPVH